MNSPSQTQDAPLSQQVKQWFDAHPGMHRPVTVAQALGVTTHRAAQTCRYLYTEGSLERIRDAATNQSVYGRTA